MFSKFIFILIFFLLCIHFLLLSLDTFVCVCVCAVLCCVANINLFQIQLGWSSFYQQWIQWMEWMNRKMFILLLINLWHWIDRMTEKERGREGGKERFSSECYWKEKNFRVICVANFELLCLAQNFCDIFIKFDISSRIFFFLSRWSWMQFWIQFS